MLYSDVIVVSQCVVYTYLYFTVYETVLGTTYELGGLGILILAV